MQVRIDLGNEIKETVERVLVDAYFNPEKVYTAEEKATISQLFQDFVVSLEVIDG